MSNTGDFVPIPRPKVLTAKYMAALRRQHRQADDRLANAHFKRIRMELQIREQKEQLEAAETKADNAEKELKKYLKEAKKKKNGTAGKPKFKCPICDEPYTAKRIDENTRKAQIFTCGHTVCEQCVRNLREAAAHINGSIDCPFCLKEGAVLTPMENKDVTQYNDNL